MAGDLLRFKASRDEGFDSLFIELTSPPGGGPPLHTDPSEELFYALEGDFEFVSPGPEGVTATAAGRGNMCVPRGTPHAYRNVRTQPGRLLVFFPGTSGCKVSSKSWETPFPIRLPGPPPGGRRSTG